MRFGRMTQTPGAAVVDIDGLQVTDRGPRFIEMTKNSQQRKGKIS